MIAALAPLRDVGGVLGSFVVDERGHVLATDLPELFDGGAVAAAGERIARLCDALSEEGSVADCAFRFGEHTLFVCRFGERTLCVVAPQPTNLAALRMGGRLACRRLTQHADTARDNADSPAAAREPRRRARGATVPTRRGGFPGGIAKTIVESPETAAGAAPRPRFFRGRRID